MGRYDEEAMQERAEEETAERRAAHIKKLLANRAELTVALDSYLSDCNGCAEAARIIVSATLKGGAELMVAKAEALCKAAAEYEAENEIPEVTAEEIIGTEEEARWESERDEAMLRGAL